MGAIWTNTGGIGPGRRVGPEADGVVRARGVEINFKDNQVPVGVTVVWLPAALCR